MTQPCSKCRDEPRAPGQRWGKRCHAEYMKTWRAGANERVLRRLLKIVSRETSVKRHEP